MHKVYWDTMHDYPDQFVMNNAEGVNKIFNREKTLYYAPEIPMVGYVHRLKKLREVAVNAGMQDMC